MQKMQSNRKWKCQINQRLSLELESLASSNTSDKQQYLRSGFKDKLEFWLFIFGCRLYELSLCLFFLNKW